MIPDLLPNKIRESFIRGNTANIFPYVFLGGLFVLFILF